MTVYKPIIKLALRAAKIALVLARREKVETSAHVDNGRIEGTSILLDPIVADKNNLDETVI